MVDQFVIGTVDRISPEAPVPIVRFDHETWRLGGAANVAHNVVALGGRVDAIGVVGSDPDGARLLADLAGRSIGTAGIISDTSRCTTRKLRVVTSRNQQVARIDYEGDSDIDASIEATVEAHWRAGGFGAGNRHLRLPEGSRDRRSRRPLPTRRGPPNSTARRSQGSAYRSICGRHGDYAQSPRGRVGDAHADPVGGRCAGGGAPVSGTSEERRRADYARRARMWLLGPDGKDGHDVEIELPAEAREVADVTGAGDTVISALALAAAAGASLADAARLANRAAGIVVGKFGPATVTYG